MQSLVKLWPDPRGRAIGVDYAEVGWTREQAEPRSAVPRLGAALSGAVLPRAAVPAKVALAERAAETVLALEFAK